MFVELTPTVLVDPSEVAVVTAETAEKSRIYLRGSGVQQHIVVDLPVAEVALALLTRPPIRPPVARDRRPEPPRPRPGRSAP